MLYAMHRADRHTTLRYDMARNLYCEAAHAIAAYLAASAPARMN
jgi:hypothetical protein